MKLDGDLDRILSSEADIVPSSGFASSVMDAVRREASAPAAIPFPWRWALPGLIAASLAMLVAIVLSFDQVVVAVKAPPHPIALPSWANAVLTSPLTGESVWVALAVLLSLMSVRLSMRFVSGKS